MICSDDAPLHGSGPEVVRAPGSCGANDPHVLISLSSIHHHHFPLPVCCDVRRPRPRAHHVPLRFLDGSVWKGPQTEENQERGTLTFFMFLHIFVQTGFMHSSFLCSRSGTHFLRGATSSWWWVFSQCTPGSSITTVSLNRWTCSALGGASNPCSTRDTGSESHPFLNLNTVKKLNAGSCSIHFKHTQFNTHLIWPEISGLIG